MNRFLLFVVMSVCFYTVSAQELTLRKPSPGKAMVYIMRTSTAAPIVKFSFFHGEKYLGKFNGGKYMVYEVDPGEHLFWVKSENTDFIEADMTEGKVYILDTSVKLGALKAAASFKPLDKNDKKYSKHLKRVLKLLAKNKERSFTEDELSKEQKKLESMIKRIQEKYAKLKETGKTIKKLTSDMYHN